VARRKARLRQIAHRRNWRAAVRLQRPQGEIAFGGTALASFCLERTDQIPRGVSIMFANRFLRGILLSFVVVGLMSTAVPAAEYKQGVIAGFQGNLVIVGTRFDLTSFVVTSSTLITVDGRPARIGDLSVGDVATVMYLTQASNTPVPQRIDALRIPY
jgi:hypothetical protein